MYNIKYLNVRSDFVNRFKIVFGKVFKSFKRTLGLVLSYLGSYLLMALPLNAIISGAVGGDVGSDILGILLIILSVVGLISFIDTIIYQVKSYSGE